MSNRDYFTYNMGCNIPLDAFRISPSQLSKFFDSTRAWYGENFLGDEGFTGSTASYLGNVVHAAMEMLHKEEVVHYEQLEAYIDSLSNVPEIDTSHIRNQYIGMIDQLRGDFLNITTIKESELYLSYELLPGIYVGGTLDCTIGEGEVSNVGDYKTTSAKSIPKNFGRAYWFQQMVYAWLLWKHGKTVESINLIYVTTNDVNRYSEKTGKQLKDYPSQVGVLTQEVTEEGLATIEGILMLVANSVRTWKEQPELRYLLAQDYRLKLKDKPKLFKNK